MVDDSLRDWDAVSEGMALALDIITASDAIIAMSLLIAGDLFRMLDISIDAIDSIDMDCMVVDGIFIDGMGVLVEPCATVEAAMSMPRPVPAARMDSGRHSTLPYPFARRLSTQLGNAPVSKYWANTSSERRWYQSVRSMGVASRSACRSVVTSPLLRARASKGRRRNGDARIKKGPRIASS
jgi:hypothetical protein